MDGWNSILSYWYSAYFQGRTVSFREGKSFAVFYHCAFTFFFVEKLHHVNIYLVILFWDFWINNYRFLCCHVASWSFVDQVHVGGIPWCHDLWISIINVWVLVKAGSLLCWVTPDLLPNGEAPTNPWLKLHILKWSSGPTNTVPNFQIFLKKKSSSQSPTNWWSFFFWVRQAGKDASIAVKLLEAQPVPTILVP